MNTVFIDLSEVPFDLFDDYLVIQDESVVKEFDYIGKACFKVVVDDFTADCLHNVTISQYNAQQIIKQTARNIASEYLGSVFESETVFFD